MDPKEEQNLVERAKTDDRAFTQLYEYYLPKIYGYIYKRVGRREEAEDVTSQTFLKVVANFKDFKASETEGSSFKSWLYRVATNTIIDYYRTRRPSESLEKHEDLPEKSPGPVEEFEKKENRTQVFSALTLLPADHQQVLYLKFFADLSNAEIALSLGITENHLGVKLHRALKKFEAVYNKVTKPSSHV